ncbi:cobyrinate a,c-diamide synthase [Acetohalobium arabaticum]|uniref:Cobyrinate a,c-diamide synthase n=1 Tax=Acetohalobium arabaticum (strain ATCC 49924 / DSM 5501 / Z-7288) TaxID=574087 RepID=D9QVW9_ACEAZ|nr:cobyrinate a,c-diamide synthase [Acetohalobium arabaticum]ADL12378.1 cobyrinic acid a,c-diamide synthase [Acetohalobium arabaticum DSM 5501]
MQPRVVIAGTQSGVGKTTLATGLMAAMTKKGYDVQPYKVGPDYIDPGFHTAATERISRNLDSWMVSSDKLIELFDRNSQGADISIIEGVMGLFDGHRVDEGDGSTAEVAKILSAPVILIIDAGKMAQSGAALAYGYKHYDSELNLAGVILNRVSSDSHYQILKEPIEELGISVLGYIPRQESLELPERHLGLVPTSETSQMDDYIDDLAEVILQNLDLKELYNLAAETEEVEVKKKTLFSQTGPVSEVKLAVARDEAFNFYYEDNLDLLEENGVELEYFSPVFDTALPEDIAGLYIGGGFPESFLAELSDNQSMQKSIKEAIVAGMPVYAECGGLMYLTEAITDFEGETHSMVGSISGRIEMTDRLQAMGYAEAEVKEDNILLNQGDKVRGHEFHYSRLVSLPEDTTYAYRLTGGKGRDNRAGGILKDNLLASYLHLHFASNPAVIDNLIDSCLKFIEGSSY